MSDQIEDFISFIRKTLDYDLDTGVFKRKNGKEAGGIDESRGYIRIRILGKKYSAHRLAWMYVHGSEPKGLIDHRNGEKTDNRICNLRDVSNSENQQNKYESKRGTITGVLGVSFDKRKKKPYHSTIQFDGKKIRLGYFLTLDEAEKEYLKAKSMFHIGR